MKITLKPLKDQVIIITGASSGVGLATARMAARQGATVVAVARNEDALRHLTEEINKMGGICMYVQADVGKEGDVIRTANAAIASFGKFDTWINSASVSTPGGSLDVSIEEMKRMFDTNFWGMVYGSRAAVDHYKQRRGSGAIINTGIFYRDRTALLQSTYAASKYAAHGWTEVFRLELEKENIPVSVSLIHPGSPDKPADVNEPSSTETVTGSFRNIYAPEEVAEAILYCAQHPKREMFVGFQAKLFSVLGGISPRLTDKIMDVVMPSAPSDRPPVNEQNDTLFQHEDPDRDRTNELVRPKRHSAAKISKRPLFSSLVVAGLGAGFWILNRKRNKISKGE